MTRAHAPDCALMFAPGVCDCAVGALEAAEQRLGRAEAAIDHMCDVLGIPAGGSTDDAQAALDGIVITTLEKRDAAMRGEAEGLRAQVEHFRRRLDAEAMRANEAAERARDATNLLGKCLEEIRKHEREYHHETAPDLLAQVEHYLMELHR